MKITIQVCYKLCAFGACDSKCPNNLYSVLTVSGIRHESKLHSVIRLYQIDIGYIRSSFVLVIPGHFRTFTVVIKH